MAKSLDQLIAHLLEEIALAGEHGATFRRVVDHARRFYARPDLKVLSPDDAQTTFSIDRGFISKLWKWLTHHNDLLIGNKNDAWKSLAYDAVEEQYPGITDLILSDRLVRGDDAPVVDDNLDVLSDVLEEANGGPRLSTSHSRIWWAICGHGPDVTRVFASEFDLLTAIASRRYAGILQGDLRKVTGQDKRSVPKRTDSLVVKGYIVKRPVWTSGHKTSRIFLRKFAQHKSEIASEGHKAYILRDFACQIFTALQSSPFTSLIDLAEKTSSTDPARRRVLNIIVRHFVTKKCLKKLKIVAGQGQLADTQICVQILREPEETDYQPDYPGAVDLETPVEDALAASREFLQNLQDEDVGADEVMNFANDTELQETALGAEDSTIQPQWNPRRIITNALFDMVHNSAGVGTTHVSMREGLTGPTVKRPLETLLVRVSHAALQSQPESVRDLSIVRNWEVQGSQGRFIHRTFDQFQTLVSQGKTNWSSVQGAKILSESFRQCPPFHAGQLLERDEFGFVKRSAAKGQLPHHLQNLDDVTNSLKTLPMPIRRNEPVIKLNDAGQPFIQGTPASLPLPKTITANKDQDHSAGLKKDTREDVRPAPTAKSKKSEKPKDQAIGRPRKFPRGAEKFWRDIFVIKYREDHPDDQTKTVGLGRDPECLELLRSRPAEFDGTLQRAMDLGLPLPCATKDISQGWVDKMKTFLSRKGTGAFATPSGLKKHPLTSRSCVLVIRSPRFRGGWPPAPVLFLSSSKAHTSRAYQVPSKEPEIAPMASSDLLPVSHLPLLVDSRPRAAPKRGRPVGSGQNKRKTITIVQGGKSSASAVELEHETRSLVASEESPQKRARRLPVQYALDVLMSTPVDSTDPVSEPSEGAENHSDDTIQTVQSTTQCPQGLGLHESTKQSLESRQMLPEEKLGVRISTSSTMELKSDADHDFEIQASEMRHTLFQPLTVPAAATCDLNQDPQSPPRSTDAPSTQVGQETALPKSWREQDNDKHDEAQEQMANLSSSSQQIAASQKEVLSQQSKGDLQALADSPQNAVQLGSHTVPATPQSESHKEEATLASPNDAPVPPQDPRERTQILYGRDAVVYYRLFICELVNLAGGMLPYSPPTFKRALRCKCLETDCDPEPNIKLMKTGTSILVRAGKLKFIQFAYQRKGFNYTKTILAMPHIDAADPQLKDLQAKLASIPYEEEYIQPELVAEIERRPLPEKRRVLECEPNAAPPTPNKKSKATRVRRELSTLSAAPVPSHSPEPPAITANTGFLTLKVSRIAEVRTEKAFNSHYFSLHEPHTTGSEGLVQVEATQNGMLQWHPAKVVPLPRSYRAIMQGERTNPLHNKPDTYDDPTASVFARNVDIMADWESRNVPFFEAQAFGTWFFIHHLTPARSTTSRCFKTPSTEFRLVSFIDGEEVETIPPPVESWDVFACIPPIKKRPGKKRKRQEEELDDIDAEGDHAVSASEPSDADGPPKKRKRLMEKTSISKRKPGGQKGKLKPRGIGMRHLPEEQAIRIGVVMTVFRTLLGGIDRHVNFTLATKFLPGETEASLRERFKRMLTAYGSDVDALSDDFQSKYLDALADDKVPSVNYDNLDSTDWAGIVEWAVKNISTSQKGVIRELPPTREEFLALHKAEIVEVTSVRILFNQALFFTMGAREDAWCSTTFGSQMPVKRLTTQNIVPQYPSEDLQDDKIKSVARSWIVSMLFTPQDKYDAIRTHEKLMTLTPDKARTEQVLADTLRQLQADKIIMRIEGGVSLGPDGASLAETRGYRVNSRFFDRFESNRAITTQMLLDACRYKVQVLDPAAAAGKHVIIQKDVNLVDGAVMAIFNLVSMNMLQILPGDDVPASRYGLDWEKEGYKTRSMDKNLLCFSTLLQPSPDYVLGDPLKAVRTSTPVPRGEIDRPGGWGHIPMWFDINLNFQVPIWELVLGTVIGIISMRPGASTLEIVRTFSWVISVYDMELVIQYLLACECIQKVHDGWETREWWWLTLGIGRLDDVKIREAPRNCAGVEKVVLDGGTIDD